jgi:hypothetical protein
MNIIIHQQEQFKIAEIDSDKVLFINLESALEILTNLYYLEFDAIIIHQKNVASEFFDLKTGLAGDILQKFSNFKMKLAVIGDFSNYESKSLKDFIFESNKLKQTIFVADINEAMKLLF